MKKPEITLIRYRMDRSREALSAAKLLYEKGHLNDAVNRLYYSCFYAVIALLSTEGSTQRNILRLGLISIKTG